MDQSKTQPDSIRRPDEAGPGVIVSPDTLRGNRVPAGQQRTKKWPVLDAWGPPAIDVESWKLRVFGLVGQLAEWNWREFSSLPRIRVFSDFHCDPWREERHNW